MELAGIQVADRHALRLAGMLRDAGIDTTAETLEHAYDQGRELIGLTVDDREAILRVLLEPPDGLAELRGVLLREHAWRAQQGL